MLIENTMKLVELHVENMIYGNIYFDYTNISDKKATTEFAGKIGKWIAKRVSKTHDDEYLQLTVNLYTLFLGHRVAGLIKGELKDIDDKIPVLEEEKQKLSDDNVKMANLLKDAYIPTQIQDLAGVT